MKNGERIVHGRIMYNAVDSVTACIDPDAFYGLPQSLQANTGIAS
jgi:hypothetical protein